jgi:predicted Zn-ribbon and HTH transcriptional regulator
MKTIKTEIGKGSKPIDKRTKEYKAWVKKHGEAPNGLGDKVERVTKATGIKKVVDKVFDTLGKDCGCDKRKEKLNKLFPSRKPECFTEEEFNLMKFAIDTKKNTFTADEVKKYASIYERVFKTRVDCTQCSFKTTVWKSLLNVYKEYL